jgi:hypothetical protein
VASVPYFLGVFWASFWVWVGLRLLFGCGWFGFGSLLTWGLCWVWVWSCGRMLVIFFCGMFWSEFRELGHKNWAEKVGCGQKLV